MIINYYFHLHLYTFHIELEILQTCVLEAYISVVSGLSCLPYQLTAFHLLLSLYHIRFKLLPFMQLLSRSFGIIYICIQVTWYHLYIPYLGQQVSLIHPLSRSTGTIYTYLIYVNRYYFIHLLSRSQEDMIRSLIFIRLYHFYLFVGLMLLSKQRG